MIDVLRRCLRRLFLMKWHQLARLIAAFILFDQAVGPFTNLPNSEAVVIVALGVIFAPVPKDGK